MRRRFFPSKAVQQVPGNVVEFEMQVRPAAVAAANKPAAPPQLPPWWWGWLDAADVREKHLVVEPVRENRDQPLAYEIGTFLAAVEGATAVQWSVTFTPVLWSPGPVERWRGEVFEHSLPPPEIYPQEPPGFAPVVELPEIYGNEPGWYWPMESFPQRGAGGAWVRAVYAPVCIAAGNTLSVHLHDPKAAISGDLLAIARVGGVEVGRVSLRFSVDIEI